MPSTRYRRMLRRSLWKADPHCSYCRAPLTLEEATLDHVVAKSNGGRMHRGNAVLACATCNAKKRGMSERKFRKLIAQETTITREAAKEE